MFKYKKTILVFVICFVVLGFWLYIFWKDTYPHKISVNNVVFNVEIADNTYLMDKGLSGHAPLKDNEGMLFIFKNPGKYGFWMKDMNFPIDIIWFDENHRIVHIEKALSPSTYPKAFTPAEDSLYVLEVSSGISDKRGFKIGDTFEFIKNTGRNLGF
jgi:uncharacterized membrane protein (UPF0127 family)